MNQDDWQSVVNPEVDRHVWALVDSFCCKVEPSLQKLKYSEVDGKFVWVLVDFDPELQEEILHQCLDVVFWRYVVEGER